MGSPILHVGASVICSHGGQVTTAPGNPRVKVAGQPVATMADVYAVAGCVFTLPGPKPSPCIKVQWVVPATRVMVGGQPVILQTSSGLGQSPEQAPQGPPSVVVVQPRVKGT